MADLPRAAGWLVGVLLGLLARLRRGKPIHPRGAVFTAVLERRGSEGVGAAWGVPWLDSPATEAAVVRFSRGAGLPDFLPDLLGLAIRLPSRTGPPVDLLLSTAGQGPTTRRLPTLRRNSATVYSSIMGYRTDAGTLRVAAWPEADQRPGEPGPLGAAVVREGMAFTLAAARGRGPWLPFGRLVLGAAANPLDPDVRFDAVLNAPPGMVADGPMARFRSPAYARARAGRSV